MLRHLLAILVLLTLTPLAFSNEYSNVAINGQVLTVYELAALESQLGARVAPGNYLINMQNGCWQNLSTGAGGCPNTSVDTYSRYGSGSYDTQGNWNHYSEAAGGAVGGTADGCIYTTFGWSNC